MRIGIVLLPELTWPQDRERWIRVEEYGFDAGWTYDHLAWRSLADGPWFAAVPTLTAAAAVTSRIRLGPLVASPNFRHPVTFAKELMTLDVVSQGRLTVAIGSGGTGYDAAMLGQPELSARERADRFEEFVRLLDEILTHPHTDRAGTYYTAVGARGIPGATQRPRPPFVLAANGPRGMRFALSHGQGWVTNGPAHQGFTPGRWWDWVEDKVRAFDEIADAAGEPAGFTRLIHLGEAASGADSADQLEDLIGRADELGFTDVAIPWPRATPPYEGSESVLADLASRLPA